MDTTFEPLWSGIAAFCPKPCASVIAAVGRQQRLVLDRNKSANHPLYLHAGPICFTCESGANAVSSSLSSSDNDRIATYSTWVDSSAPAKVRTDGTALLLVASAALRLSTWWWSSHYEGLSLNLGSAPSLDGIWDELPQHQSSSKLRVINASRSNALLSIDALAVSVGGGGPIPSLPSQLNWRHGIVSFCVSGTQIEDHAMHVIGASLTSLEYLDISGCMKLTDLNALSRLTHLKRFNMSNCLRITTSSIHQLTSLSKLEVLMVNVCKALESLNPLLTSAALREVQCNTTKVDSDGIQNLGSCTARLERLTMANSPRVQDVRIPLRLGASLLYLSLNGCSVTDVGVSTLPHSCSQLQELSISSCLLLTQLTFVPKRVNRLDISRCAKITDDAIAALGNLQALKILNLSDIEGLTNVSCLSECSHLEELDVSFTGIHTSAAFRGWDAGPIAQSIRKVELEACRIANRHEVVKIFASMKHQSDGLLNWA